MKWQPLLDLLDTVLKCDCIDEATRNRAMGLKMRVELKAFGRTSFSASLGSIFEGLR